jgi:stage V sporulation protein R
MYIYEQVEVNDEIQLRRTAHTPREIKELLVTSYGYSPFPSIAIVDGRDALVMIHNYFGMELDKKYAKETMIHMERIWGRPIVLKTVVNDEEIIYKYEGS